MISFLSSEKVNCEAYTEAAFDWKVELRELRRRASRNSIRWQLEARGSLEPRALPVFAIGIAEFRFQHVCFLARADRLHDRNHRQ
jgi:hypothetical protein